MSYEGDEALLQKYMHTPQLFVGNSRSALFPSYFVTRLRRPLFTDISFIQRPDEWSNPRWSVHTICDMRDRNFVNGFFGPKLLPESTRYRAMFTAHAVSRSTHANSQRRQAVRL